MAGFFKTNPVAVRQNERTHFPRGRMSPASTVVTSAAAVWTARIFFAIATLFLAFDGVTKLFAPPAVVAAFTRLGIPLHVAPAIGILELACLALYFVPRTSVLGAILLAAYLGGAVA